METTKSNTAAPSVEVPRMVRPVLAPCPHCGGQGEDIFTSPVENTDVIRCAECGAETKGHEPGTGEHVKAWNAGEALTEEQATNAKREQGFE